MSLAATASNWTNDNIETKKRVPTIGRPAAPTIEETELANEKNGARVNKLLDVLAADNVGNGLANFEPIHKPIINVRRKIDAQEEDDDSDDDCSHSTFGELVHHQSGYDSDDAEAFYCGPCTHSRAAKRLDVAAWKSCSGLYPVARHPLRMADASR